MSMAKDLVQIEIPELGDDVQATNEVSLSTQANHHGDDGAAAADGNRDGPGTTDNDNNGPETAAAEYALHILFTQFVRYAERKLAMFSQISEDNVEQVLGEGVDEEFDTILEGLGHVARRKPKPVIDSVMYWRKSKKTDILPSIFILSRVLMEVIKQTPPEVLGADLCEKLEDIVSRQVQTVDPTVLASSLGRQANWRIMARLLGEMSAFRFASVSDRFIEQLEQLEKLPDNKEDQMTLILEAMPYLKLALYPEESLEEAAIFVDSLSKFSARSNSSIRGKYASALVRMLSPLAEVATVEVNQPIWAAAMRRLYHLSIDRRLPSVYLTVTSLCLSPAPFFADHWLPLLESLANQKNNKNKRALWYVPAAQLTHCYVFRCPESLNAMTRKIEFLRKLLFSNNQRKYWQSLNGPNRYGCVSLLRTLFHAYKQHTLDELLFPLLVGADAGQVTRHPQLAFDQIIPERAVLAIRAFVLMIIDLRNGERPEFPISDPEKQETWYDMKDDVLHLSKVSLEELKSSPSIPVPLQTSLELFSECICQIAVWLSSEPRNSSVSFQLMALTNTAASAVGVTGGVSNSLVANASMNNLLLAESLRSWSAWWPIVNQIKHLEVLCKCAGFSGSDGSHTIPQQAALIAIEDLAKQPLRDIRPLLSALTKVMMATIDTPCSELLLKVYVSVIESFVKWLLQDASAKDNTHPYWTVVEEIEGNGLFLLSSRDHAIRALGLRILYLITELDSALVNNGDQKPSRVINLLQNTEIAPLVEDRTDLSSPEKARVDKFKSRKGASVARLAASEYGVDAALWLRLFPRVASLCFDAYPIPVALCRSFACDRLVEMHNEVANLMDSTAREGLPTVEQWRLYLMLVCATLTSTGEQKIHVPTHTRKKSVQRVTLHHQKITSAKSVFRIAAPMLSATHPGIRDAAIAGLACTNVNTYRTLLECLEPLMSHSVPRVLTSVDAGHLVTGIAEVLRQTSAFLNRSEVKGDPWICDVLTTILGSLKGVLSRQIPASPYSGSTSSLRRVFCRLLSVVYKALGPETLFGNFASQWLEYWSLIESWSPHGSHQGLSSLKSGSSLSINDSTVTLAQLEFERQAFELATSEALSSLLEKSSGFITNIKPALRCLHALISSVQPAIIAYGELGLCNLIESFPSSDILTAEIIMKGYPGGSKSVSDSYFSVLGKVVESNPEILKVMHEPLQFLPLAVFKVGDRETKTRLGAARLIHLLEMELFSSCVVKDFQYRLHSFVPTVYKREIFNLSQSLAQAHGEVSPSMFFYITKAFHLVPDSALRDILSVLLPWIQNIELKRDSLGEQSAVLAATLEITVIFGTRMQNEVEALWVTLCTHPTWGENNALAVMEFLIDACIHYRSPGFIGTVKSVLVWLQASPAAGPIVERILGYMKPEFAITQNAPTSLLNVSEAASTVMDRVVSQSRLPDEQSLPPLSYQQIAVTSLINILTESRMTPALLPLLLHICIAGSDHFVPFLQLNYRKLLLNVIGLAGTDDEGMILISEKLQALRWQYEDDAGRVPDSMASLIHVILERVPVDLSQWPNVAVQWAVSCPARHIACRSFQILRCLGPSMDQKMLSDMLARLSTTIAETGSDIQGFAVQILMTLNAVTDRMTANELTLFPHLFWVTVASLGTTNEREYIEALSIMSKLLTKYDWKYADVLRQSYPSRWDGEFSGVLPLVLQGLRSANAHTPCYEVLDQLITTPKEVGDLLWGDEEQPLMLAAYLPRFQHAMDKEITDADANEAAFALAGVVEDPIFQRILDSFGHNRFWNKTDLLNQYVIALTRAYPSSVSSILMLFMSTLSNKLNWVRLETLSILKVLLPEVNLKQGKLASRGADIVSPLLRLLQTRYAEQALGVLDNAGAILAGKMDRHILRMSLGSKQYLKEYENTATLYGIPEESGWAVPSPASLAVRTRNNVHAVFYTCDANASSSETAVPAVPRPQLEFQVDDYRVEEPDENMRTMDRMLSVLDDLDSFFTKVSGSNAPAESSPQNVPRSRSASESEGLSIPQFYDKKVSLILNRSLARNPSQVSFRTSFADTYTYQHSIQRSLGGATGGSTSGRHGYHTVNDSIASSIQQRLHPTKSSASSVTSLESSSTVADHASSRPSLSANNTQSSILSESGSALAAVSSPVSPGSSSSQIKTFIDHPKDQPRYKTTVAAPKSPKSQAESSFRLESLLRGKRRSKKAEKEKRKTPEAVPFQFP